MPNTLTNIITIPDPDYIDTIQHIAIDVPGGSTSGQAVINEVDLDKTFLIPGGSDIASPSPMPPICSLELTDSTHVTATRAANPRDITVNACVVSFNEGIKSIQRGTITLTDEAQKDTTINQVDLEKSFVTFLGANCTAPQTSDAYPRLYLLNSTTIRTDRDYMITSTDLNYEVVEFL